MIVICELRIKNNYKDDYVVVSHWKDVDKKSLINKSNNLLKEIINTNPLSKIEYTEQQDNDFGGRLFFTATIIIGMY